MNAFALGRTGLRVTPFGLGLAALGRPGYINLGHHQDLEADYSAEAMEARAHAALDAAWDHGVRYFDVARSYGKAEAFLASWLQSRRHTAQTIGSKWGYSYTADWQVQAEAHEVKQHSLEVLNRQIEESRELLGSHLRLYQIHSATLESGVLENMAVLNRLAKLKAAGLRIGLSVSGPQQSDVIRRAVSLVIDGHNLFDTCQATWNLLERSAGEALREAHQAGLGIIIKEGVANGRLTERNRSPAFAEVKRTLQVFADCHEVTIDAIALASIVAQPWVDTVLSGAVQKEHIKANIKASALSLSKDQLDQLESLAESPMSYWNTRANLAWN